MKVYACKIRRRERTCGLIVLLLLQIASTTSKGDTLSFPSEPLRADSNRTLVSPGDVFELGFFKLPPSGNRWYIGIWYAKITERTYVWVANRDTPLLDSAGTFGVSYSTLFISDRNGRPVWSMGFTSQRITVVAELLDSGNFVLRSSSTDDPHDFLWQSFDFPTDTLLPQMKVGTDMKRSERQMFLTSWKSVDNLSSGDYQCKLKINSSPEISVWRGNYQLIYHSGPWIENYTFRNVPPVFDPTWTRAETTFSLRAITNATSSYKRLLISYEGFLILHAWNQSTSIWDRSWTSFASICEIYNVCGSNAYCQLNMTCTCLPGFEPRDPTNLEYGRDCKRKTHLNCLTATKFIQLVGMGFAYPDTTSTREINQTQECEATCLGNCDCVAYAVVKGRQSLDFSKTCLTCLTWNANIQNIKQYSSQSQSQVLFIRKDAPHRKKNKKGKIIGLSVGIPTGIIFLSLAIFCFWKRKQKRSSTARESRPNSESNIELMPPSETTNMFGSDIIENRRLDFAIVLRATQNFSDANEIGQGGFGRVYKGRLPSGEEIAVKKLLETSRQGITEFQNEVTVIASLQHINLVRLLGWSAHNDEKVLIYELLQNGSLEDHLFGPSRTQASSLTWATRFCIIDGIASGLEYIQEESRIKIIHRDLKPANVLLDQDMSPKISDFGLARISARNENTALTTQSAGTYGYMSPEYAGDGIYSTKSDVFSFGVIVLEVISGKKNRTFNNLNPNYSNLLSYAWTNRTNGTWQDIVDEMVQNDSSWSPGQALRCIQIGLLCVQNVAEYRPKMSSVVSMLRNESAQIPEPKEPGFFIGSAATRRYSSSGAGPSTVNQRTFTGITPR